MRFRDYLNESKFDKFGKADKKVTEIGLQKLDENAGLDEMNSSERHVCGTEDYWIAFGLTKGTKKWHAVDSENAIWEGLSLAKLQKILSEVL